MKAITLYQPWATLVAIDAKKIETRSWYTKYRGPLAIHASTNKRFAKMTSKDYICGNEPFCSVLEEACKESFGLWAIWDFMPFGAVIAICDLEECWKIDSGPLLISKQEKAFGDYTPGRFMWMLENTNKLDYPILIKGKMGLWEWDERIKP